MFASLINCLLRATPLHQRANNEIDILSSIGRDETGRRSIQMWKNVVDPV